MKFLLNGKKVLKCKISRWVIWLISRSCELLFIQCYRPFLWPLSLQGLVVRWPPNSLCQFLNLTLPNYPVTQRLYFNTMGARARDTARESRNKFLRQRIAPRVTRTSNHEYDSLRRNHDAMPPSLAAAFECNCLPQSDFVHLFIAISLCSPKIKKYFWLF